VNRLNELTTRARGMLSGFTPGQRGVILVAVAALVLGAIALGRWAAQPTWAPLFSNLSGSAANAVVEQLTTDNVPYQLSNNGTTVLVPQEQVYALRISLQGKGVVNGSGGGATGSDSGYSVLDSQGMTATDFQQNIAYQRALESELSRTLQAIGGVNTAIVHLAIPKKDVFTTETDHPTASVLLSTSSGASLSRAQIRSVMHLVAGSVPGLDPSDVTVSDATGAMLSVREDGRDGSQAASDNDTRTQQFEEAKGKAAQAILDKVVGVGHSVVRVNAELNFDSSETTSDIYANPSGSVQPLTQATSHESYNAGGTGAGGALGQAYPTLTPGVAGGGAGTYDKSGQTVNNAVNHTVGKVVAAPGSPKRLSVAVVLDKANASQLNAQDIQTLMANAVGIDPARGDTVQVNMLAFDTEATKAAKKELADEQAAARTGQYLDLAKKAALGLALLTVALIVMRKRRKPSAAKVEVTASDLPEREPASLLPLDAAEQLMISASAHDVLGTADADILDPTLERERLRDEVAKFVDAQPEEIAAIVQGWLGQRKS